MMNGRMGKIQEAGKVLLAEQTSHTKPKVKKEA